MVHAFKNFCVVKVCDYYVIVLVCAFEVKSLLLRPRLLVDGRVGWFRSHEFAIFERILGVADNLGVIGRDNGGN